MSPKVVQKNHQNTLRSRAGHHHGIVFSSKCCWFKLGRSLLANITCIIPTIKYANPNLCKTPGILKVLRSLFPMLLITRPKKISVADLRTMFKISFGLEMEFLNWDWIDMTIETPIIHMNQGKTKSATVNPFHRALKIKSQNTISRYFKPNLFE